MTRLHHCHPLSPCPICRARAIEVLLDTGRPEMALQVARGLADAMVEAMGQAMIGAVGRAVSHGRIKGNPQERARKSAILDPSAPARRGNFHEGLAPLLSHGTSRD